jgi:hypothetical protein
MPKKLPCPKKSANAFIFPIHFAEKKVTPKADFGDAKDFLT